MCGKCVGVAETEVLAAAVAAAGATIRSAFVAQRARMRTANIRKAVGAENLVLFTKTVIHTHIKGILIVASVLVRVVILRSSSIGRSGIKIGNVLAHRINPVRGDNVSGEWRSKAHHWMVSRWIRIVADVRSGRERIKNCPGIELWIVCRILFRQITRRKCLPVESENPFALVDGWHAGEKRLAIAEPRTLVVTEDKRAIFP